MRVERLSNQCAQLQPQPIQLPCQRRRRQPQAARVRRKSAVLHDSHERMGFVALSKRRPELPNLRRSYPTETVLGQPNSEKQFNMAARTLHSTTCLSKVLALTFSPRFLRQFIFTSTSDLR